MREAKAEYVRDMAARLRESAGATNDPVALNASLERMKALSDISTGG